MSKIKFGLDLDSKIPIPDAVGGVNTTTPQTDATTEAIKGLSFGSIEKFKQPESQATPETEPELNSNTGSAANVVTTDELESNSSQYKVPEDTTGTGNLSFESVLDVPVEVEAPEEDPEVVTLREENEKLVSQITDGFDSLGNIGDFIEDVEDDESLQDFREELTEINNKVRAKKHEFKRQVEGIQDMAGLTRAQKNARINEVDRKNSREIADLEIIAMARQGRFNDAQTAVNRKVEIELAERQTHIENLKFLYGENKDRFTTIENRAFQEKILTEERAYQKEYDTLKTLEDSKLQMMLNATEAGASMSELSAIQNAGSMEALLGTPNAGRYMKNKAQVLDERLKNLQIANANKALNEIEDSSVSQGISPITGKPFTLDQAKSGTFAVRMESAQDTLNLGKGFFGSDDFGGIPDFMKSDARKQWEQAENDFITAQLRKESGAAIGAEEYTTARKVYIPLYSDDAATIAAKKKARITALAGMKNDSAGAYAQNKASVEAALNAEGETPAGTQSTDSYLDTVDSELKEGVYGNYEVNN